MNRDNDKGKVLINRSLILGIGKFLLFIVIIARLYYLQVYQADKYKTLADENRISTRCWFRRGESFMTGIWNCWPPIARTFRH